MPWNLMMVVGGWVGMMGAEIGTEMPHRILSRLSLSLTHAAKKAGLHQLKREREEKSSLANTGAGVINLLLDEHVGSMLEI
jgi:hypothetical protein